MKFCAEQIGIAVFAFVDDQVRGFTGAAQLAGDFFIGGMSDFYKAQYGDESLRYSMLTAVGFYVIAAGLYFIAAPRLKKDWHAA